MRRLAKTRALCLKDGWIRFSAAPVPGMLWYKAVVSIVRLLVCLDILGARKRAWRLQIMLSNRSTR